MEKEAEAVAAIPKDLGIPGVEAELPPALPASEAEEGPLLLPGCEEQGAAPALLPPAEEESVPPLLPAGSEGTPPLLPAAGDTAAGARGVVNAAKGGDAECGGLLQQAGGAEESAAGAGTTDKDSSILDASAPRRERQASRAQEEGWEEIKVEFLEPALPGSTGKRGSCLTCWALPPTVLPPCREPPIKNLFKRRQANPSNAPSPCHDIGLQAGKGRRRRPHQWSL